MDWKTSRAEQEMKRAEQEMMKKAAEKIKKILNTSLSKNRQLLLLLPISAEFKPPITRTSYLHLLI